jgi:hypothetical protein
MDLTREYPAAMREKLHGVVQLRRTIDKGKALVHGNIGEYDYNCPMDQALCTFLGIDPQALLDVIKNASSDHQIYAYVKPFVAKKPRAEIEHWNETCLKRLPVLGSAW